MQRCCARWRYEYETYLDTLHAYYHFQEVIVGSNTHDPQGRRRGMDAHAKGWADREGIDTTVRDANWLGHGRSGGPRRNTRMLRYVSLLCHLVKQRPGLVIAFPGGPGTDNLCDQAAAFSVPVLRYPELPADLEKACPPTVPPAPGLRRRHLMSPCRDRDDRCAGNAIVCGESARLLQLRRKAYAADRSASMLHEGIKTKTPTPYVAWGFSTR